MKFVFWNIKDKSTKQIKDAIKSISTDIDFLVLAENDNIKDKEVESLSGMKVFTDSSLCKEKRWIYIYSTEEAGRKISYRNKFETSENDEMPVRVSSIEGFNKYLNRFERFILFDVILSHDDEQTDKLLLGITHMVSKYSADEMKQRIFAYRIRQVIESAFNAEPSSYNKKCILFGDFNLNPYDSIMSDPLCFRSYKSLYDCIKSPSIYGENPFSFYNPSYFLRGESSVNGANNYLVPGTYYYKDAVGEKWNLFDQLIVTPNAKHIINDNKIKIITEINGKYLLNKDHIPDSDNYSDHLPIKFELKI